MSGTPVFGYQALLGISANNPVDVRYDFQSSTMGMTESYIDANGLRGTRKRDISRVRQSLRHINGRIHFQPSPVELAALLPWITCGTPSGSGTVSYPLADTPVVRYITQDNGPKVPTWNGCVCDRATLSGRQGQPLDLFLDIVGLDETLGDQGSFPSLTIDTATPPFIFTDLVLQIAGTTYNCEQFEFVIDNVVDKERFYNSLTLITAQMMDRHVLFNTSVPYGTSSAAYVLASSGEALTATFTGAGTSVLTLSATKWAPPRHSPHYNGRGELNLPISGEMYADAANANPTVLIQLHV